MTPQPVEVVGWGPDVSAALDRAEDLAHLAVFSAVFIGALCLLTLAWIAVAQLRR
jgi:hypothetical protein